MYCYSPRPQPCSRPPPTQASRGESRTPTGKSGAVSCGVTAPFSWVLVHRFLLCPPRVYFPVLCKFWQLYGGVNGDLLKRAYTIPRSTAPRAPAPAVDHCRPGPPQETLKHSSGSVSGVPGSWCAQGLFEPSERLWQECGLILNANSPLLPSYWGFSDLGCGVSPHGQSSEMQPHSLADQNREHRNGPS